MAHHDVEDEVDIDDSIPPERPAPQLDLYPILEGENSATPPRITEDNFRALIEWSRLFTEYVDRELDLVDGGGP